MRVKTRKWKEEKLIFPPWNFWFWRTIEAKKAERCSTNWKKNKRAKKDIYITFFLQEGFLLRKESRKKKGERRPDATDVPRPRSMTTECT